MTPTDDLAAVFAEILKPFLVVGSLLECVTLHPSLVSDAAAWIVVSLYSSTEYGFCLAAVCCTLNGLQFPIEKASLVKKYTVHLRIRRKMTSSLHLPAVVEGIRCSSSQCSSS